MWTLWCFNSACERHCGNEPLALGLPSEPSVASEAGIPVNTSQISFLFFFVLCFCRFSPNVGWVSTWPDRHRPSPSSVFLSSFFPSFLSLLCLGFSFLPPFLLNWVVWQAGLSDSAVYVGSLRGRGGHPPLCAQRRVSFSVLLLHEWTRPRFGGNQISELSRMISLVICFPPVIRLYQSNKVIFWFLTCWKFLL